MSDVYTQTDTLAPCGVIQACAPVAPAVDGDAILAQIGGTPGVTELACDVAALATETCFAAELAISDTDDLNAGTLVMRLNITTAQMNVTWEEVYVCRLNSSCVSQETLGSATGLALDVSAGGVFTVNVTLSAAAAHDPGDVIYIPCVFTNAFDMGTRSVAITPDQNIDTPFTPAAGPAGWGPLLAGERNRLVRAA